MINKIRGYWIFLILVCLFATISIVKFSSFSAYEESFKHRQESCTTYLNFTDAEREKFEAKTPGLLSIPECEYLVNTTEKPVSFFLVYDNIFESTLMKFIFPLFLPVFLLYPVVYRISQELKSGYVKYFLLRKNYKQYVLHLIKTSYKQILPVIAILLIFALGSMIKSDFNFNPTIDVYTNHIDVSTLLFYNDHTNYIIYGAIVIFNLLFYVNVSLIVLRNNNKNTLVAFVESFLIIYLWWCFTFIILGRFLSNFGISGEQINIMEIYTWSGIENSKVFLISNAIFYVISLLIVLLSYKNKEKLIMKCED